MTPSARSKAWHTERDRRLSDSSEFRKTLSDFRAHGDATLPACRIQGPEVTNHIAHFEIFASDVERARKFYEKVFAWRFEVGGPPDFYHIHTGPPVEHGISRGLIAKRRGPAAQGPINAFRVTIIVDSIADVTGAIEPAGGKLRSAVIDIPGVGKVIEFADTEDNIACAMQYEAP
jgi:uncharacterized protein